MQISGSARLSATRAAASPAPIFEFGRHSPMDNDAGSRAISYGPNGDGSVTVNGASVAMTRGYDGGRVYTGPTETNLMTYSYDQAGHWTLAPTLAGSNQALTFVDHVGYPDPWGGTKSTKAYEDVDAEPMEATWEGYSPAATLVNGTTYEVIVYIKLGASSRKSQEVYISGAPTGLFGVTIDLQTGTTADIGAPTDLLVTSVGSWWKISYYVTAGADGAAYINVDNPAAAYIGTNNLIQYYLSNVQISPGQWRHQDIFTQASTVTTAGNTMLDVTGVDDSDLAAGTPTYNVVGPGCGIVGVKSDGTAYFQGSSGPATAALDVIAALALQWRYSASKQVFLSTSSPSGTGDGIEIYTAAGEYTIKMDIEQGATTVTAVSPTLVDGQNALFVAAVNRGEDSTNGFFAFTNSTAGVGVNPSGASASITDSANLTLFSDGDGGNIYSAGPIYGAWLWEAADIFSAGATGAAEMQAVASELTQRFFGVYPQLAHAGDYTMTITRATEDGVDIARAGVTNIFYLASGTGCMDDEGVLIQAAATNQVQDSDEFDAVSWTNNNLTIDDQAATGPDLLLTADKLTESSDGGDTAHQIYTACTVTLGTTYELTCTFKDAGAPATRGIVLIYYDPSTAQCGKWVDISTGAIGNDYGTFSPTDAVVETLGNGWYRLRYFATALQAGTAYAWVLSGLSEDGTYTGDGSPLCYLSHVQCCDGKYRHSTIRTSGGTGTRNALVLNADSGNIPSGAGTLTVDFKVTDTAPTAVLPIFQISDGTTDHSIKAYVHPDGPVLVETRESGGDSGDVTIAGSYTDGAWHHLVVTWKSGQLTACVDGNAASDFSCTLPTALTTFALGRDTAGNYLNGRLRNLVTYSSFIESVDDAWGGGWGGARWF